MGTGWQRGFELGTRGTGDVSWSCETRRGSGHQHLEQPPKPDAIETKLLLKSEGKTRTEFCICRHIYVCVCAHTEVQEPLKIKSHNGSELPLSQDRASFSPISFPKPRPEVSRDAAPSHAPCLCLSGHWGALSRQEPPSNILCTSENFPGRA